MQKYKDTKTLYIPRKVFTVIHPYLFEKKIEAERKVFFFTTGTKKYKFITFNTRVSHLTSCLCRMFLWNHVVFKIIVDTPDVFFDRNKLMYSSLKPRKI